MGDVIRISDRIDCGEWKSIFTFDNENSTLYIYENNVTGEIEIVQMDDDNKAIRTLLDETCTRLLRETLLCKEPKDAG